MKDKSIESTSIALGRCGVSLCLASNNIHADQKEAPEGVVTKVLEWCKTNADELYHPDTVRESCESMYKTMRTDMSIAKSQIVNGIAFMPKENKKYISKMVIDFSTQNQNDTFREINSVINLSL